MTTITVDGSSENTEVLNSEEQDSLAVGEQLEQEQNSLLAGKYKDAQELESAYIGIATFPGMLLVKVRRRIGRRIQHGLHHLEQIVPEAL